MIKLPLILLLLILVNVCNAQQCRLPGLSKKYNFSIAADKTKDADGDLRISKVTVKIHGKANNKMLQQIDIKPDYLFQDAYKNCSAARSFITGKNKNAEVVDNDYGDFIVADFNFDGREDFAVKRDSGGNGGAFYEYYVQNKIGKFEKDQFLTDEMIYFPGTIDAPKKRLITYVHASAHGFNENIYKYNPAARKWIFLKQTYRKVG